MANVGTHADGLRLELAGVEADSLHAVGTIPGVAVLLAAGHNGPGTARVKSDASELRYRAPGSNVFGDAVAVGSDGSFLLEDGEDRNAFARVQAYKAHLVTGEVHEARVLFADRFGNDLSHADLTAGNASGGYDGYQTWVLKNRSGLDVLAAKMWIEPALAWDGTEGIRLSKDGGDYYAPDSESHADVLTWDRIVTDGSENVRIRRTFPAASEYSPTELSAVRWLWCGI